MKNKRARKLSSIITTALFMISLILPSATNALEIAVEGNGSESESEVVVQQNSEVQVEQINEADVENSVQANSNTGENSASQNTGGEVSVDTGDATTNIEVQNQTNNSTADIDNCCSDGTNVTVKNNGAGSANNVNVSNNTETNVQIENSANIENNIQAYSNTGKNTADSNNGNVSIETGDAKVLGSVKNGPVNVYDVDVSSGTSANQSYLVSGNGEGSTNHISSNLMSTTNVNISSVANIQNNMSFDANTGKNNADRNLGDAEIVTGDSIIDFFLKNGPVNMGGVDIDCCDDFDPGDPDDPDKPEDPGDPGDPKDPGDNGKEDGNGGDGQDGDDDGDGKLLAEAASTTGGNGVQIIGLSDTTSPAANSLFFWAGLAMIALGLKFIGEEYLPKPSSNL